MRTPSLSRREDVDKLYQIPIRELHFNDNIWGPTARTFDAQRFQANPKLLRSQHFRPWGGGSTMCPGRFLAKRAIYVFVAILLSKYELHLDENSSSFPKGDNTKPSPGVIPLREREDVLLRIISREK
jgi:cholesterol 7alpha-monooxygenase